MRRQKGAPGPIRVLSGSEFPFDWDRRVATGVVLEHTGFSGWLFVLDVAMNREVVALTMRPAKDPDSASPDEPYWEEGGISSTEHLRKFPLDALARSARAHVAADLAELAASKVGFGMSAPLRREVAQRAANFDTRSGTRRGPKGLDETELARFMQDYLVFVDNDGSVADFAKDKKMALSTFDNRRRRAKQLGLFVGSGKHGRPGGTLTKRAEGLLEQEGRS